MCDSYFLKIKVNQVKMMAARGYDITDEEWILEPTLTAKQFKKRLIGKYGEYPIRKLMFSEYKHPNKSKPLFVFYICKQDGKQINIDNVTSFINKLTEENSDGLLVIDSQLSPAASNLFTMITEHNFQIIKEEDLSYNVIDHVTVPKHILLTDKEANKFKNIHGLTNRSISFILTSDPVAQYYNYPINSIVKIYTNPNLCLLSKDNFSYRVVVKGE
jgi:DNA-directed RNA polymerase I, II, and III subunit RPABC1